MASESSKGVTAVVAAVLMIAITIALTGTAYIFIFDVFKSKTSTVFEVVYTLDETVIIRNTGSYPISHLEATINNVPVPISATVDDPMVLGYWHFDENSSTTARNSVSANDGTLYNFGWTSTSGWVAGKFGTAIAFDGANDYINITNAGTYNLQGNFTIGAWIKPNTTIGSGGRQTVMATYTPGWIIDLADDTDIEGYRFYSGSAYKYDTGSVYLDWTYLVVTYDRTAQNLTMYINGTAVASWTVAGIASSANSLAIGRRTDGAYFRGLIDDVFVYNRTMTEDEVKAVMKSNFGSVINPGHTATITLLTDLPTGIHRFRLCSSQSCQGGSIRKN